MTREEALQYILYKINDWIWYDEDLVDKLENLLFYSLLIPKPKFEIGDKVLLSEYKDIQTHIVDFTYSPHKNLWMYKTLLCGFYLESELELIKRKE